MKYKNICVIGLGYIGLPTAALLANRGYKVHGVDIDKNVVDIINQGRIHIIEPELDTFVHSAVNSGLLTANLVPMKSDVFIIAVPTPFHADKFDHSFDVPVPNIDYVLSATKAIAPYVDSNNLILLESTSPVGTTEKVKEVLSANGVDTDNIYIAHSPERVLPGHVMKELVENDRVVGGLSEQSTQKAADFYRSFVHGKVLQTDARTAEMAKLTENSFRDVNIAFANELSILCEDLNIDVLELIHLANHHPRVNILDPSCGVGGHCISVDPWFIVDSAKGKAKLIEQARRQNDYKADWVIEKVRERAFDFKKQNGRDPLISCMGLAFKPNIDDLRESPALYITLELTKSFNVIVVEPNIDFYTGLRLVSVNEGVKADIVVYLVKHSQFYGMVLKEYDLDYCGISNKVL